MVDRELWLTWYGVPMDPGGGGAAGPARDLNDVRVLLSPSVWHEWPDRSGWFNRMPIRIPAVVEPGKVLLHGYRLMTAMNGPGDPIWLPFASPILFEERLPVLPVGALQLRPGAMDVLPTWTVFGADRNPAPRFDRSLCLYEDPEKPSLLTHRMCFDERYRLLSCETLNGPSREQLNGDPNCVARAQTTRMWVKFEH